MRTMIVAAALALAASSATGAQAAAIHEGGMTGPEVAAWLQAAGYRAQLTKDSSGDPLINSASEGVNFKVLFYDCEGAAAAQRCKALQFAAGFDLDKPLTAERMNEWNKSHRYLKAYINADGDPYVEYDVNVNAGRTTAGLDDDFGVWTGILSAFTTFIGW